MAIVANTIHRRGFLGKLAALPLIGGGVSILGAPTAAATPITVELLERYVAFLSREHLAALAERQLLKWSLRYPGERLCPHMELWDMRQFETFCYDQPSHWFPPDEAIESLVAHFPPSSRAAVVLSAAGASL